MDTQAYPADSSMRAAEPMLVNCVAYQEGRKLADIPKEDSAST